MRTLPEAPHVSVDKEQPCDEPLLEHSICSNKLIHRRAIVGMSTNQELLLWLGGSSLAVLVAGLSLLPSIDSLSTDSYVKALEEWGPAPAGWRGIVPDLRSQIMQLVTVQAHGIVLAGFGIIFDIGGQWGTVVLVIAAVALAYGVLSLASRFRFIVSLKNRG